MQIKHDEGQALLGNLERVIFGKREPLRLLIIGLLSEGHVLLEDVPGVGKTTLARALARSLSLGFKRVQFTPDLMPSDILGAAVLRGDGEFEFKPGPIFTHVLLADEINRASPRTQSALLEAMSEAQVTSDGNTRPLPRPFFVMATQNPIDAQGTYPLPEAQLDRFLLRLNMGYPDFEQELAMLYDQQDHHPLADLQPVLDGAQLTALQQAVRAVRVERPVGGYMLKLVHHTRQHVELAVGASPRGALALFRASQAAALLAGRDYVTPDDVQGVALAVLAHRLELAPEARYGGRDARQMVEEALEAIPTPT
ncbi:MoxR family ATPase [Myxococcota bacterium]|nr:MoxR family ATPase [Myxococcota bacterium]MBU1432736.1 MoxR family ATPase [Myxococcota bacterium]MBU1899745.1 MoxR family ATPase [Myxococcota bacterium]